MTERMHFVRRRDEDARRSLVNAAHAGGVTLVLGAGVSVARGLPSWSQMVRALWERLTPPRPTPAWLCTNEPRSHPLAYQILLEEIEGAIRWELAQRGDGDVDAVDARLVHEAMVERIAEQLYAQAFREDPTDTLGVLVDLLRREQRSPARRVLRVITFNTDDLLERGANANTDAGRAPVLYPVPRASFHPRYDKGAHDLPPINVFHLHGFIPRSPQYARGSQDTLVFTDAQYWESVAFPTSFANRVMTNAMQDSRCVFIGMSMTDVNMMRWLGLRYLEFAADRHEYYEMRQTPTARATRKTRKALSRHFWVCAEPDDPSRLIASHLERRGVTTVTLPAWGRDFEELIAECFG